MGVEPFRNSAFCFVRATVPRQLSQGPQLSQDVVSPKPEPP